MDEILKATIEASTFTAIIRLAKAALKVKPDEMSRADFERQLASEVAAQAMKMARLDDSTLEIVRNALVG